MAAAVDFDDPVIIFKAYEGGTQNPKRETPNTKHKTQNTPTILE